MGAIVNQVPGRYTKNTTKESDVVFTIFMVLFLILGIADSIMVPWAAMRYYEYHYWSTPQVEISK